MVLEEVGTPIVLAPLAGGPSTPELCAAVCDAGGLGFVASGYLSAEETARRIVATRALTARPFAVNVFVPGEPSTADLAPYVARLGPGAGEPRFDDDDFDAKLALLRGDPPAVVSFTFGCPPADVVASLPSEVWVTVTSADEARRAVAAGADALVVQGAEAGGHRGSFADTDDAPLGLVALLQVVRAAVGVPLIATGGVMTREAVEAVLAAGAAAAQCGTAFLLCPEAGTSEVHRRALGSAAPTALTRAFTGRLAGGIVNGFMRQHSDHAPSAYPEIHFATAPLRAAGRERGDADVVNLWAGQAHALAREAPAADV
ncbi:MAG TPA: nitronate monooxygenase, partial [Solirubrobacteraceae bacterium]|nr:nitronate monooxygenase [Solirubrobacteraceae bacterium]